MVGLAEKGRGLVCDCWVLRSGTEDHTENYWHNYLDDLTNRCYLRPNAADIRIERKRHTLSHVIFSSSALLPNVNVTQMYAQRAFFFLFVLFLSVVVHCEWS